MLFPLNAIEERQTNPVQVGNATFTTGYYSYHAITTPEYSGSDWCTATGGVTAGNFKLVICCIFFTNRSSSH